MSTVPFSGSQWPLPSVSCHTRLNLPIFLKTTWNHTVYIFIHYRTASFPASPENQVLQNKDPVFFRAGCAMLWKVPAHSRCSINQLSKKWHWLSRRAFLFFPSAYCVLIPIILFNEGYIGQIENIQRSGLNNGKERAWKNWGSIWNACTPRHLTQKQGPSCDIKK